MWILWNAFLLPWLQLLSLPHPWFILLFSVSSLLFPVPCFCLWSQSFLREDYSPQKMKCWIILIRRKTENEISIHAHFDMVVVTIILISRLCHREWLYEGQPGVPEEIGEKDGNICILLQLTFITTVDPGPWTPTAIWAPHLCPSSSQFRWTRTEFA